MFPHAVHANVQENQSKAYYHVCEDTVDSYVVFGDGGIRSTGEGDAERVVGAGAAAELGGLGHEDVDVCGGEERNCRGFSGLFSLKSFGIEVEADGGVDGIGYFDGKFGVSILFVGEIETSIKLCWKICSKEAPSTLCIFILSKP